MKKLSQILTIGQLSARTGVAVSAIRYYEARGLLTPFRNAGGQRRFMRADIRRLSFILIAQQFGFSLDRIVEILSTLPKGQPPNAQDWARIGEGFRADLDARIASLEAFRDKLDQCIGCGCLSLERCGLYNPNDAAMANGAGPRYLMGDAPKTPSGQS